MPSAAPRITPLALLLAALPAIPAGASPLRVATFNAEDVRPSDVTAESQPRLARIAAVIDRLDPDIILLQEIARDAAGINAQRFADRYLPDPASPERSRSWPEGMPVLVAGMRTPGAARAVRRRSAASL